MWWLLPALSFFPLITSSRVGFPDALRTLGARYQNIQTVSRELQQREDRNGTEKPRLILYVQNQAFQNGEPLSLLPLLNHNTGVTHIIVSSFHVNTEPGEIKLNDDLPSSLKNDNLWLEVKILQSHRVKVLAMLGGAAQGTYRFLGSTNETLFRSYYDPLVDLLRRYSFDGIDLDIEEPVDVFVALRLIHYLHRDMGPHFIITLAPVGTAMIYNNGINLSGFSYFDLEGNATDPISGKSLISWYNTQFYSGFGDPSTPATYQRIIGQGWDPARIVMGVLDNNNDGHGFVATKYVVETIKQLRVLYPSFGGVYGWDYFDAGIASESNEEDGTEPWQWVLKIKDALYSLLARRKR